MKKFSLFVVLIITLSISSCGGEGEESRIKMYVEARSGLIIRANSNTSSEKIGLVPMGESVSVLESQSKKMTISGKTGHWTRISYNGTEGWVFGGFLSATPVEKLAANQIKAIYNRFEFGDTASYYFTDTGGKNWIFKDNRSKQKFHIDDDNADQGLGVNTALVNKTFIVTYKKVRQPAYPDGPMAEVLIIVSAQRAE